MATESSEATRYCGRVFSSTEIELIRGLISGDPGRNRAQLSRLVCDELKWLRPDGRRKDMSCRVAMLQMHRDGLIALPPPLKGNGNGRSRPSITSASDSREPVLLPAGALGDLELRTVDTRQDSRLWNELIERHHYLGYTPLPGAQLRYLVFAGHQLLSAMGFGASAWKVRPRDQFIGWTAEQRVRNLPLIANNARFLILPWVRSHNLASRLLGAAARQLPRDWRARYGVEPVLLETFVERERFRGTCYQAANWIRVGQTQGRGKLDRRKLFAVPVKDIFLYPLRRDFRQQLQRAGESPHGS